MPPAWRIVLKTAAATAVFTTIFWFAVAVWWLHRPGSDHAARQNAGVTSAAPPAPAWQSPAPAASQAPLPFAAAAGSGMIVPVLGVRPDQLVDTFADARANGTRPHDALDIPAPLGTPVVAAAPGRVEKLFLSGDGGNTVYVRAPDGALIYYYAHLDAYAPGLAEGVQLRQGDPIGRVGATGNANPAVPHLHFAVWQTRPDRKWWEQATAIDPYPLLRPPR